MASWTGGMDPTANLRAATFENFMNFKKSGLPEAANQYPYPIGGRFLSTNVKQAQKLRNQGGLIDPKTNPKRFNFSTNFLGAGDRSTMDEQMSRIAFGGNVPAPGTYGLSEKPVHKLANVSKKLSNRPSSRPSYTRTHGLPHLPRLPTRRSSARRTARHRRLGRTPRPRSRRSTRRSRR